MTKYLQNDIGVPEIKALLIALSDREPTAEIQRIFNKVKPDIFVSLTERHRITPLVYRYLIQNEDLVQPTLINRLKELSKSHAIKALMHEAALIDVCKEFNNLHIDYIVIKGPQLSHFLYGDGSVRTSVDLDIFLRDYTAFEKAKGVLHGLGYNRTNYPEEGGWLREHIFKTGKHECFFINNKNRVCIDLHIKPVANSIFDEKYHRIFFNQTEQYEFHGTPVYVPSPLNYFLFLCYHGAVHQYGSLHWLADICYFTRLHPFSSEELIQKASELRLERHLALSFMVMNKLCGITQNYDIIESGGKSGMHKKLYRFCILSMTKEKDYAFTIKGRFRKTIYRLMLSGSLTGKADVVLSIFFRYTYKAFMGFGNSKKQIPRKKR